MSKININQYYVELDRTIQFGLSRNEQSIRTPFLNLLNKYAREYHYEVIAEEYVMGTKGKKVRPDGVVKNNLRLIVGLWESKDEKDDLDAEIEAKNEKGYPLTNILFEDGKKAVLYQKGEEVLRIEINNPLKLNEILTKFIAFKSDAVYNFEIAIERFKADIPIIVESLREKILECKEDNEVFLSAQEIFLNNCKTEINPDITLEDIREMMIQHILTSDIFNKIFDDAEFHRHNTIAIEIERLIGILFSYTERRNLLQSIEHYYEAINATAAGITDHHEKQKFLKVLYENFYKAYNPKAADRLGVIYTPNEIVQFMVKSTDYLLNKHFDKTMADKNVEILDPATGTGTFICEIIDNIIPKQYLEYKYKNELHANEVAILPYYIANLNIEFTYQQKMKEYSEFTNLCFVDTLDNIDALNYANKQHRIFGFSSENSERIKRQNSKKISIIIGNPPYNANQLNENENNKNREYTDIDKRIKDTYIKNSVAQKTKLYDMYARFLRWASDRIDENGIIAFVSNNSFLDAKTYDGFRKCVSKEFNEIHIIDLKGDARTSGERRRKEGGNIFSDEIRVGVAIYFLVKKGNKSGCKIYYNAIDDYVKSEDKKEYIKSYQFSDLTFKHIIPDKKHYWLNIAGDNDWDSLVSLANKKVFSNSTKETIFNSFTLGVSTNRDEWVYGYDKKYLKEKIQYFIDTYNYLLTQQDTTWNEAIKWSRDLKKKYNNNKKINYDDDLLISANYRPFSKKYWYSDKLLNDVLTRNHFKLFGNNLKANNLVININSNNKYISYFSSNEISDLHFLGDNLCLPLYYYDNEDNRLDNITDWGLKIFINHYQDDTINKKSIFQYIYSVLHDPIYRHKYELNLKRELPRLPFYDNFWKWSEWGKQLLDLHTNYEDVNPYSLEQKEKRKCDMLSQISPSNDNLELNNIPERKQNIKVKLNANKEKGVIEIDGQTSLAGIPKDAWEYKLGNRSAIEWVLDQYKEKKPSDPTIAEYFNTYKFANHKEYVINLIKKVCNVSIKTVDIIKQMENES